MFSFLVEHDAQLKRSRFDNPRFYLSSLILLSGLPHYRLTTRYLIAFRMPYSFCGWFLPRFSSRQHRSFCQRYPAQPVRPAFIIPGRFQISLASSFASSTGWSAASVHADHVRFHDVICHPFFAVLPQEAGAFGTGDDCAGSRGCSFCRVLSTLRPAVSLHGSGQKQFYSPHQADGCGPP